MQVVATLTHHGHNTNVHFCFSNAGAEGEHVRFALASGIHVNEPLTSSGPSTEHPKPIQVEVKKMEEAVREIHEEMLLMRTRSTASTSCGLRDVNEGTNARIMHSSALTITSRLIIPATMVLEHILLSWVVVRRRRTCSSFDGGSSFFEAAAPGPRPIGSSRVSHHIE